MTSTPRELWLVTGCLYIFFFFSLKHLLGFSEKILKRFREDYALSLRISKDKKSGWNIIRLQNIENTNGKKRKRNEIGILKNE